MNRREALRSLAGGCAAGALAAVGVMTATSGSATPDDQAEHRQSVRDTAEAWLQLTHEERKAVIAEVEADRRRRSAPSSPAWDRFRQNAIKGGL